MNINVSALKTVTNYDDVSVQNKSGNISDEYYFFVHAIQSLYILSYSKTNNKVILFRVRQKGNSL